MINIKRLQVEIPSQQKVLLYPIDLEISSTQVISLIGESGSGKSLLTRAIIGDLSPNLLYSGQILIDEVDYLSTKAFESIQGNKVAYIPQNPMRTFNHVQTIFSHFKEVLLSHFDFDTEHMRKIMIDSLEKVHLSDIDKILQSYPTQLSGGQLQRVMIAMNLCLRANYFLFDEPTSALDKHNKEMITAVIKELKDSGKGILLVTHDYKLLKELGGMVIVLYKGNEVERNDVDRILNHPQASYTQQLVKNHFSRLIV